jgi:hypothetical protein
MATTLIGFSAHQTGTLKADITLAGQLAMAAVNSMLLTASGRPSDRTAQLLWWVFTISPDSTFWDRIDPVKNHYAAFAPRFETVSVNSDASAAAPNTIEFDAYVRHGDYNRIFIRDAYFAKAPRERATTLIHETAHLWFKDNTGDGHPGGQIIMFEPGNITISYDDAIRNPYCYQYYADWISKP